MTHSFWDFCGFSEFNYTKKEGVIVFYFEIMVKPLKIKTKNKNRGVRLDTTFD
jgi:hypothetical protein